MKRKFKLFNIFIFMLLFFACLTSCGEEKVDTPVAKEVKLEVIYDKALGDVDVSKYDETAKAFYVTVTPKTGYLVDSVKSVEKAYTAKDGKYTVETEESMTISVMFTPVVIDTFSLKVEFDDYHIDVTYTEPNKDSEYIKDTEIEVSYEVKDGYVLNGCTVNDEEVDFTDGAYKFKITQDTEIVFTTDIDKSFKESVLEGVQESFKLKGSYHLEYQDDGEEVEKKLITVFDEEGVYTIEYTDTVADADFEQYIVDLDGFCAVPYLTLKNTIEYNESEDLFDDYDNPFTDLTVDDFEYVEAGVFKISDDADLDDIASCITGWNEPIDEIIVYVEDDQIVKMEINTALVSVAGRTYYSTYEFEVSEHGEAVANPGIVEYEETEEHKVLKDALAKITNNYTVTTTDVQEGYDDIVYDTFVTKDVIYIGYAEDGVTRGFVQHTDGVREFTVKDGAVSIGLPYENFTDIADIQGIFDAFSPALFEPKEGGVFVARSADIASAVAQYIGEDPDKQALGRYVTELSITVAEGVISEVNYTYVVFGEEGKVKLTYSEIGTTEVTLDFDNATVASVFDDYVGEWTGVESDGTEHTVVITKEKATVDGKEFIVDTYTEKDGFMGTIDGVDYCLAYYFGYNELMVQKVEDESLFVVERQDDRERVTYIPYEYQGLWYDDYLATYVYISNSKVTIGMVELESYEVIDEGLILVLDGVKYYGFFNEDEDTGEETLVVTCYDWSSYYFLGEPEELVTIIDEDYIGTWANDDTTVVITALGIEVNGVEFVIKDFDNYSGYTGTLGDVTDYGIGFGYTTDYLMIGTQDSSENVYKKVEEKPSEPAEIPARFYDTFIGTHEKSGITYTLVISEDGITLNGETCTSIDYSVEDDLVSFTCGDLDYYADLNGDAEDASCYLSYTDYSLYVLLERQ